MIASRVAATALNSEKMEADWRNQYTVHDRELLVHSMIAECEKHVFEGDREQVRKLVLHYENSSYVQAATRTEYNERLKRLLETARGGELRTKLQDIHNKRAQLHQQDVASTMHATHQWVQDHSAATPWSPVTMGMVGSRGMESSPQTPAADPNSNNVAAGKKRKLSRTNTANSQTAKPPKAPRGGKKRKGEEAPPTPGSAPAPAPAPGPGQGQGMPTASPYMGGWQTPGAPPGSQQQHHAFSPPAPLQQPQPQQAAQQQFGLSHMQQQRISPQAAAQLQYQQQFPHTAPMNNQSPSNMQDQLAGFGNIPPTRLGSISGLGPGFAGITPSPHMSQGSPHTPMSVPAHLMTPGALGGMPPQGASHQWLRPEEETIYWAAIDRLQPYATALERLIQLRGPHPRLVSCLQMLRNNRMAPNPDFLVGLDVLDKSRMALERFVPAALQARPRAQLPGTPMTGRLHTPMTPHAGAATTSPHQAAAAPPIKPSPSRQRATPEAKKPKPVIDPFKQDVMLQVDFRSPYKSPMAPPMEPAPRPVDSEDAKMDAALDAMLPNGDEAPDDFLLDPFGELFNADDVEELNADPSRQALGQAAEPASQPHKPFDFDIDVTTNQGFIPPPSQATEQPLGQAGGNDIAGPAADAADTPKASADSAGIIFLDAVMGDGPAPGLQVEATNVATADLGQNLPGAINVGVENAAIGNPEAPNAKAVTAEASNAHDTTEELTSSGDVTVEAMNADDVTGEAMNAGDAMAPATDAGDVTAEATNAVNATAEAMNTDDVIAAAINAGDATAKSIKTDAATAEVANAGDTAAEAINTDVATAEAANAGDATADVANGDDATAEATNAGDATAEAAEESAGPTEIPNIEEAMGFALDIPDAADGNGATERADDAANLSIDLGVNTGAAGTADIDAMAGQMEGAGGQEEHTGSTANQGEGGEGGAPDHEHDLGAVNGQNAADQEAGEGADVDTLREQSATDTPIDGKEMTGTASLCIVDYSSDDTS